MQWAEGTQLGRWLASSPAFVPATGERLTPVALPTSFSASTSGSPGTSSSSSAGSQWWSRWLPQAGPRGWEAVPSSDPEAGLSSRGSTVQPPPAPVQHPPPGVPSPAPYALQQGSGPCIVQHVVSPSWASRLGSRALQRSRCRVQQQGQHGATAACTCAATARSCWSS